MSTSLLIFGIITAIFTWIIAEYIDNHKKIKPTIIEVPTHPITLRTVICSSMNCHCKDCNHALFHIPNESCNNPKKCHRHRIASCR